MQEHIPSLENQRISLTPETFVRVIDHIPDIAVDLRYATADNFTGKVIYSFRDAWLRYGTVCKLADAQRRLRALGYSLLIWDAFRPAAAQFKLWEVFPVSGFVANPEKGFSPHTRGHTVDVTLITLAGTPVEMPSEFDDFSPRANRDYTDATKEAASNALLMERIMSDCGFHPYSEEWWHFVDLDSYPVEESFIPR